MGAVGFQVCKSSEAEIMPVDDSAMLDSNSNCEVLVIEHAIKFVVEQR